MRRLILLTLWGLAICSIVLSFNIGRTGRGHIAGCVSRESDSDIFDNIDYGIPIECDQIIDRKGYSVGYSRGWKLPVWVSYRLTSEEVTNRVCGRWDVFLRDPLVSDGASMPDDYYHSGYDRGHLAPAADMLWSTNAMVESFYMSNMAPQRPSFNRGIWCDLESWVRSVAVRETNIVIITGPIVVPDDITNTIGRNRVVVPTAFYKVIYDETPPEKMIGFIISNEGSRLPIREYAVSVDAVEEITGMDFFSKLDDIK